MKQHSGSISSIHFSQFAEIYLKHLQKQLVKENQQRLFNSYRESITTCLTTIGIGVIILATTYFFFIQLAKYGW
jgi:hypothetical protein